MYKTNVNLLLFGIIRVSLKIPIFCPGEQERGCINTGSIRRCGKDQNHSHRPYRYLCMECGKSFYAHTSKLFKQFSRKQQLKIMLRIAKTGSKHQDIAKEFGISTAAASRLATKFRKFLKSNLKTKYGYYFLEQSRRAVKTTKSNSVIIDETFVRILGQQYYIIVAINGYSDILCWKLVQKRNWVELVKLFKLLFQLVDDLSLVVTDGFNAYCKALRNLSFSFELIHVQHIHKHPRGTIKIRFVQLDYVAKAVYEFSWLTQSQIFKKYQGKSSPSSYFCLVSVRITLFRLKSLPVQIFDTAYRRRRASDQLKRFKQLFKLKRYCRSKSYNDEGQVFLFKQLPIAFEISYDGYRQSRLSIDLESNQSCGFAALLATLLTSVLMEISLIYTGKSITSYYFQSN